MSIPPICQGILTLTTALVNPISYDLFCKCTPKNNISSHFHSYMLQTYLSLSMHFLPYVTNRPLSKYAFFTLCYKQTFIQVCIFYTPVACVQLMRFRCAICIASPVYVSKNTPCYSPTLSIVVVTFFSALQLHIFCCIFIKMQNLIKCIPIFRHCRTNFSNNATTPFFLLSSHFPYDQKHFIFKGFF